MSGNVVGQIASIWGSKGVIMHTDVSEETVEMDNLRYRTDAADERLIAAMRSHARASISDLARITGMARGTVHSRLDRLERCGVITGFGPDLEPAGRAPWRKVWKAFEDVDRFLTGVTEGRGARGR